jgi:hypothetical protein
MPYNEMSKEDKILLAAYNIFLLFGYHGTTLQQIAMQASVSKSAVITIFVQKEDYTLKLSKKYLTHILIIRLKSLKIEKDLKNQNGF